MGHTDISRRLKNKDPLGYGVFAVRTSLCLYSYGYTKTSCLHPRFIDDSRNFYGRTKTDRTGRSKQIIGVKNDGGVILLEKHSSPSLSGPSMDGLNCS